MSNLNSDFMGAGDEHPDEIQRRRTVIEVDVGGEDVRR